MTHGARLGVVVGLVLFWAAIQLPNVLINFAPFSGCLGYVTQMHGNVVAVECAAARAGIVPGDRIELAKIPLDQRYNISRPPYPGIKVAVPVLHDGKERVVTLTADPNRIDYSNEVPATTAALSAKKAATALFVLIAALILLRRPEALW